MLSTWPFFVAVLQSYLPIYKTRLRQVTDCLLASVSGKRPAFPTQRANNLFLGIWFLLFWRLFTPLTTSGHHIT